MRYNWPFYAVAGAGTGLTLRLSRDGRVPRVARLACAGAATAGLYWSVASLLVSWWVYDHSGLDDLSWLPGCLPESPHTWANLHCGLDETSPALLQRLRKSEGHLWDFYDAASMTEPSIRRARALTPPVLAPVPVSFRALPAKNSSLDAVFLFFAAHEIRDAAGRDAFFAEIQRVLRPGGRVVMLEHTRSAANFLAFGPGFMHFFPLEEWRRVARDNGLRVVDEKCLTPFVHLLVMSKMPYKMGAES